MVIASLTESHDRDDLQSWVAEFGSSHPVCGDHDRDIWNTYALTNARPLCPGGRVAHRQGLPVPFGVADLAGLPVRGDRA